MDGYRHHLLRGSRNGGFRKMPLDKLEMTWTALFSFEGINLIADGSLGAGRRSELRFTSCDGNNASRREIDP